MSPLERAWALPLLAAGFAALVLVQALPAVWGDSATFDEPLHIAAGYAGLVTGDRDLNPEHPPLAKELAALPLLAIRPVLPERAEPWDGPERWRYAFRALYRDNDADRLVTLARLPMVAVAALLPVLVLFAGRRLLGAPAGAAAGFLAAFCPTLLAHGHLVTTDVPMAVLLLATVLAFLRACRAGGWKAWLAVGLLAGLALLTKYTALLLAPILGLLALVRAIETRRVRPLLAGLGLAAAASVAVLWAGYGFRFAAIRTPGHHWAFRDDTVLPRTGPARLALLAAHRYRLLPEGYVIGLGYTLRHSERRQSFLAGEISDTGGWSFFPIAIALKTPVPLLLLGLGGVALFASRMVRGPDRFTAWCLVLPPALWLGVAVAGRLAIGHRHVFPIYPLLYLAGGAAAARLAGKGRAAKALTAALLAWMAAGTVRVAPHPLAYFNELAGGPDRGWRWLVDSNLDWGQDLKGLARFARERGIDTLYLSYFGTADPGYHGLRYVALPSFHLFDPPAAAPAPPGEPGTWIAVSATTLQGLYLRDREAFAWLRGRTPVARIGWSIFVYRL